MSKKTIEEVKKAWEDRLMDIPGVTAVGIGLTEDRGGSCIVVWIESEASAQVTQIPKTLEGHPVRIRTKGIVRPL